MRQSISQFESAFEQETSLERRRREQLRRRAANRSRARRITSAPSRTSKVRFSVLAVCLTVTVVVVVVAMFEALALPDGVAASALRPPRLNRLARRWHDAL